MNNIISNLPTSGVAEDTADAEGTDTDERSSDTFPRHGVATTLQHPSITHIGVGVLIQHNMPKKASNIFNTL